MFFIVIDSQLTIGMELGQAGIVIKCRCGGVIAAGMSDVLFGDRGRVKVGRQPLCCPACTAIYRYGERLKYELGPMEIAAIARRLPAHGPPTAVRFQPPAE